MSNTFCYLHLRNSSRDAQPLLDELRSRVLPAWRESAISVWGVWRGLFGVASNELLVVTEAQGAAELEDFTQALSGIEIHNSMLLAATARPDAGTRCVEPGLYVFRFFDVSAIDVDEVVRLSVQAWNTFENSNDYRAQPQGLFRPIDPPGDPGRMLLVTWYDGLDSWQVSRQPAPEATENFLRRRELTQGTLALATTLVSDL